MKNNSGWGCLLGILWVVLFPIVLLFKVAEDAGKRYR